MHISQSVEYNSNITFTITHAILALIAFEEDTAHLDPAAHSLSIAKSALKLACSARWGGATLGTTNKLVSAAFVISSSDGSLLWRHAADISYSCSYA